NFKLGKGGEYLGLSKPDGTVADEYNPEYPAQTTDFSYGKSSEDGVAYFRTPTPGAVNNEGFISLLTFDESNMTFIGAEGVLTEQVVLSIENGDEQPYTLNVSSQSASWLQVSQGADANGATSDQINIIADTQGLEPGTYYGVVTAESPNYLAATLQVQIVVRLVADDWVERDLKFDGIGVAVDSENERILFQLGPDEYYTPATFAPTLTYQSGDGYTIGINGEASLTSDITANFGSVTYGDDNTIQLYKDGNEVSDYALVFTPLSVIDMQVEDEIVRSPKTTGLFRVMSTLYDQDSGYYNMGIETRGNSASRLPKLPYDLELSEAPYPSDDINVKLLELRKDDDWILDALYRDETFARNLVCHDVARALQPYAFIDDAGVERGKAAIEGKLTEVVLNHEYLGVFALHEQVDRKLLDLTEVDVPLDEQGIEQWDEVDFSDPKNGSVVYKADSSASLLESDSNSFEQKYPKVDDIRRDEPLEELIDFVTNSGDQEFIDGVEERVDVESVLNFWLMINALDVRDTLYSNYFLARNESGKFFIAPWDCDAALYYGIANSWHPERNHLIERLMELTATGFNTRMKQRWTELRQTIFTHDAILARFEAYSRQVRGGEATSSAITRNLERWPDAGDGNTEFGYLGDLSDRLHNQLGIIDGKIADLPE
ncbi:MAG: Unknown protein, partial [uncultured Thiotrichaceae bacterium]